VGYIRWARSIRYSVSDGLRGAARGLARLTTACCTVHPSLVTDSLPIGREVLSGAHPRDAKRQRDILLRCPTVET
jgi:hypothetical protein